MIHDLQLALRLKAIHNVSEIVASRGLFRLVLKKTCLAGKGENDLVSLNMSQESLSYRYIHKLKWKGILFIHLSNEAFLYPLDLKSASA